MTGSVMNLLLVEDQPMDADLACRALAKSGRQIQVEVVSRLAEARRRLDQEDAGGYDLVLLDLNLPDGDGRELLTYIRARRIPVAVVVLTGSGDEQIVIGVLKAGADNYISKHSGYLARLADTLVEGLANYQARVGRETRLLLVLCLQADVDETQHMGEHMARYAPYIRLEHARTVELALEKLGRGPCAQTGEDCFDVILMDYRLPGTSALDTLKILREQRQRETPVILVIQAGDEEIVQQAIKLGASGFVTKTGGYLFQIPLLIENVVQQAHLQRQQAALTESEARYRRLAKNAPDLIYRFEFDPHIRAVYLSPALKQMTGYAPEEAYSDRNWLHSRVHPDDRSVWSPETAERIVHGQTIAMRWIHKDGRVIWLEQRGAGVYDDSGRMIAIEGVIQDVTERKQAEVRLTSQVERMAALNSVAETISTSLDLNRVLQVVLNEALNRLGMDAANVLLLDPAREKLEFAAGSGQVPASVRETSLQLGHGLAGVAAAENRMMHVPDLGRTGYDAHFRRLAQSGFVTYLSYPLAAKGEVRGVLEIYHRSRFEPDQDWLDFLETLSRQAAIAIDNATLVADMARYNRELRMAYDETIEGWSRAMDLRDRETEYHTLRVTSLALRLARKLGMSDDDLVHMLRGGLLHDIGKMGVPDGILNKPGPLTPEEWQVMRMHPLYAHQLLSPINYLRPALPIPYCHHEKWDGSGYPQGLKGDEIPLAARIFAIVDVWDAMISDRPYRPALSTEEALAYCVRESGRHFDPMLVQAFLDMDRTILLPGS
jgi:PAS domain S-box-containing protein/putative nucleotidyltransferase with HDIG domain